MFDRAENEWDAASDLDWLIHSDQAPPAIILEGLVHEFYPAIYDLVVSILDSRPAARTLTANIFARAVLERHTYRSEIGAKIWLYRLALEDALNERRRLQARRSLKLMLPARPDPDLGDSQPATALDADLWLALDALAEATRAVALLHYLHAWGRLDLEQLLDCPAADIEAELERTRQGVLAGLHAENALGREYSPAPADLDELIRSSLRRRWPRREFTPAQLDELARRMETRRLRQSGRRRLVVSVLEIAVVLLIILFAVAVFWGAERLFPEPTPTSPSGFSGGVTRMVRSITATPLIATFTPRPSATPEGMLPADAFEIAKPFDNWETLAERMHVSVEALQQLNRIPPGEELLPGVHLLDPHAWLTLESGVLDPGAPSIAAPIPAEPVELAQAVDMAPRYRSLWLDGLAVDYGPLSYIGPPRTYRVQTWQSPEGDLTLSGLIWNLLPEAVQLRLGNRELAAQPLTGPLWFSPWQPREPRALGNSVSAASALLYSLVERGDLSVQDALTVIGRETEAGIDALVGEQMGEDGRRISRFWLDDRTGLVLRRAYYAPDGETVAQVYRVRQVAYNVAPPAALLTDEVPWRGGYARTPAGDPEDLSLGVEWQAPRHARLELRQPPLGFDPATASLVFQYPESYTGLGMASGVGLFADGYYLSRIALGDPWTTVCDRSPDGRWLAYVSAPFIRTDRFEDSLRVFSLAAPTLKNFTLGSRAGVSEFAFSPDSRRLAFLERMPEGPGSLAILDLESRGIQRLMNVWDVRSLVWSPDGAQLAMIAHMDEGREFEHILVVGVEASARVVYTAAIDVQSHRDQRDWPMIDWGVEFPVERGGLDACAQPPNR